MTAPQLEALDGELADARTQAARRPALRAFTDDDGNEVEPLAYARLKLGLPDLRRVVKRAKADALYDLELNDGTLIPIGTITQLRDPRRIDDALGDHLGSFPPKFYTQPQFRPIAIALLRIADLQDGGAAPGNLTRVWVARFANERATGPFDLADPAARHTIITEALQAFHTTDERLYLHGPSLLEFVRIILRERIAPNETYARLARLGFDQHQVTEQRTSRDAKPRKRRYHRSPAGFDPEDDE